MIQAVSAPAEPGGRFPAPPAAGHLPLLTLTR